MREAMKAMNHKIFYMLLVAGASLATVSCQHKELCYDHSNVVDFQVVFDWQHAPDANPGSMSLYLHPAAGGAAERYDFTRREGGQARITTGTYHALCLNSDNTDWAQFRGTESHETFEIHTLDAEVLSGNGFSTRSLPKAEAAADERIAMAPGMVWSDHGENVDLTAAGATPTVTLYPEETVCHYTVTINNVVNTEYVQGTILDGTLSGLAEGYLPAGETTTDTAVTYPFEASLSKEARTITGSFLSFGDCATAETRHYLTIYMILTDQSKWYSTHDVTDQVHNAADPTHVSIVLDGLELPKPIPGTGDGSGDGSGIGSGGGFQPEIEDWNSNDVEIVM